MTKLFLITDGFTRAYPLIIIFSSFLNSILNNNQKDFWDDDRGFKRYTEKSSNKQPR